MIIKKKHEIEVEKTMASGFCYVLLKRFVMISFYFLSIQRTDVCVLLLLERFSKRFVPLDPVVDDDDDDDDEDTAVVE